MREPSRRERTEINRALDRWGAFGFFKDKSLLIQVVDNKKIVCLVTDELENTVLRMMIDPYSAGLAIGELKKQFMPSIAGADLFARYGNRNKFYVVINDKAEQLVLYGRDIMGESIIEASEVLPENELVVLLNTRFDTISIGRTRFPGKLLFQKGRVTITNIADAGYYLREEG
jgi:60S ribosome subunit biogenesis protein NIP7